MKHMHWTDAKKIMGKNFIGPKELKAISRDLNVLQSKNIPAVPFGAKFLKRVAKDCLLIFGVSKMKNGKRLTLNNMRGHFGWNPASKVPCFYNQDWYLKEKFARATTLKTGWYLIRKDVAKKSRGVQPDKLLIGMRSKESFPSAILTAYAFFSYYFLSGGDMLWKHDFVWCCDKDKNGDRIYAGRYKDPKKINKDGFNIHRHLFIRPCYGAIIQLHP